MSKAIKIIITLVFVDVSFICAGWPHTGCSLNVKKRFKNATSSLTN